MSAPRRKVGIQAWLPGMADAQPASGARTRLLGLLGGLREIEEATSWDITVLTALGTTPDASLREALDALPYARVQAIPIRATPTWRRIIGEKKRLAAIANAFDVFEHASLPMPSIDVASTLLIHDLRDLGRFARGGFGARRLIAKRSVLRALTRATITVVPSLAVAREVKALAQQTDLRVVPAALRVPDKTTWPTIDRFPPRPIVSLARPEPRKDLPFAVRVYAEFRAQSEAKDLPDLVFAGPPDARWSAIRALAQQLGIGGHVHFVHDLTDEERWPLLHNATAMLFPSRLEGFGLPALEAALVGCPVLLRKDGVPDQCFGAACIAIEDSIPEWSACLLRQLDPATRYVPRGDLSAFEPATAARAWTKSWEFALETYASTPDFD